MQLSRNAALDVGGAIGALGVAEGCQDVGEGWELAEERHAGCREGKSFFRWPKLADFFFASDVVVLGEHQELGAGLRVAHEVVDTDSCVDIMYMFVSVRFASIGDKFLTRLSC